MKKNIKKAPQKIGLLILFVVHLVRKFTKIWNTDYIYKNGLD